MQRSRRPRGLYIRAPETDRNPRAALLLALLRRYRIPFSSMPSDPSYKSPHAPNKSEAVAIYDLRAYGVILTVLGGATVLAVHPIRYRVFNCHLRPNRGARGTLQ